MKEIKTTPAACWLESFPIGNGHIGAMVYGGFGTDRIELTHNTFFSGAYSESTNRQGAYKAFYQAREEIEQGNYKAAHETAKGIIGERQDYGTNLPVGTLHIAIESGTDSAENEADIQNYKRSLDISKGLITEKYVRRGNPICVRTFLSHPDRVLVYEFSSEMPVDLSARIELYCENSIVRTEDGSLIFETQAVEAMHCDRPEGVRLSGCVGVQSDVVPQKKENGLNLTAAKHAVFYVAMASDFDRKDCAIERLDEEGRSAVSAAEEEETTVLFDRHTKDVQSKMMRCTLELSGDNKEECSRTEFQFQLGRYLLLCASREDSILPAHLQGIWNDNVACRIGWTCDMHLDINTQMNYWPAEVTNLSEMTEPFTRFVCDRLAVNGAASAKNNYNLPGWVAEIVTNAWGFTAPYWAVPIAPYPSGGMWILTHLWEHYQTTGDFEYLQRVFQTIEQAAAFCVSYVFRRADGVYSCGPSISAENSFKVGDETYYLSDGCTGEILMIRQVLEDYLAACDVMQQQEQKVACEIKEKAEQILLNLIPYRILEDGTIAEWAHDYPAADSQHRHTSHLLGVFPFAQITPEKTPKLADAVEMTIQKKLNPPENWEDTGWSRSMLMLYEARLKSGNQAYGHMQAMLANLLAPNGMIIHPPTRGAMSFDNVYEMDGNTGFTSAIAEMLLQSHDGVIQLLPALPKAWKSGAVRGLRARGGVTVDIAWENNRITEAYMCADLDREQQVKYREKTLSMYLKRGERTKADLI